MQNYLWGTLPIAERELFVGSERQVYGNSRPLHTWIGQVLTATNKLIIRPGTRLTKRNDAQTFMLNRVSISAELFEAPPEEPYVFPRLIVPRRASYAPGGRTTGVEAAAATVVTDQQIAWAKQWLRILQTPESRLSQEEAIGTLDILMSTKGKQAIHRALPEVSNEQKTAILEASHTKVRRALGNSAYWPAVRERYISGYRATRGDRGAVRQVGGRLPSDTKRTTRGV